MFSTALNRQQEGNILCLHTLEVKMKLPHEEAVIPHCSQQSKNCLEGNLWPYSCKFTYETFFQYHG